ncbi:MAG: ribokinase [Anaerolineae bacterium]|nr:ribokinase [Anaerolineae bacterium]
MKPEIVVVGSVNNDMTIQTDHLPGVGETVIGGQFFAAQGGKGANQAVAAARLGAKVTFVARLGRDAFGEASFKAYQAEGMILDHLIWDDQSPTGVALILIDREGRNYISVASGANLRLSPHDVERAEAAIAGADVLLLQLEVPPAASIKAAEIARRHGVRVILNPAPAAPLPDELLSLVDYLTPNDTELEMLLSSLPPESKTADLPSNRIKALVVTLGSSGAQIIEGGQRRTVPAFVVDAVDTTAAGDAFNAGLAMALARGLALDEAVRYANAVSALSVTRLGAQTSLPYAAEVDSFLDRQERISNFAQAC